MTLKTIKIYSVVTSFLFLMACQTMPQKDKNEETLNQEAMAMGWTQLQQNTLNHLREKSFGEANVDIKQMMAFAGRDIEKWEYIRMAMISMPKEMAESLVEQALRKSYVTETSSEQFAFSRVLTQIRSEQRALELLDQLIVKEKTEEFVYWRARIHLLLEQEEPAEIDYKWLIQQDPKNTDYLSQYATLLNYLGRDDDAMALLKNNEHDVDLLFRQVILLIQKDEEKAGEKFEQLKTMAENTELTAKQQLEIGEMAYWLKDYDYSLSVLEKVKSGEHINNAKLIMANVLVEQEQYDRASIMYQQVQNGPEEHAIPAYQLEVELYRNQGEIDKAMDVANSGLQFFEDHSDLLYVRAMLHGQRNDISALERDLQSILNSEPNNPDALNALGYTWADNDMNLDLAYEYIMNAHEQKPKDKAILDSVGWIYYKKGDLDKAEKYLRLAIEGNTRDQESFEHLIVVLEAKGNTEEAEQIREQAETVFKSINK